MAGPKNSQGTSQGGVLRERCFLQTSAGVLCPVMFIRGVCNRNCVSCARRQARCFRGTILGASFVGTNLRTKKLIKNAADVIIRLRTGAAVTLSEEEAFKVILGVTTSAALVGNFEDTAKSIDDAMAEMQSVIDLITGGGDIPIGFRSEEEAIGLEG